MSIVLKKQGKRWLEQESFWAAKNVEKAGKAAFLFLLINLQTLEGDLHSPTLGEKIDSSLSYIH